MNFNHISSTKKHFVVSTTEEGIFYLSQSALETIRVTRINDQEFKLSIDFKKHGNFEHIYISQEDLEEDLQVLVGSEHSTLPPSNRFFITPEIKC